MKKFLIICITGLTFTTVFAKNNLQISKFFFLKDATKSYTARKYKIKNIPSFQKKKNIIYAAKRLDVIRKALKKEIKVTSWYRNAALNKKVGGAKRSQHRDGLAIDFKINGNSKSIRTILNKKKISYDQLIYYPKQNRVHISFKKTKKQERNQYLIKR